MIVLDTSVLVYAVGAEHLLQRPAQSVIEATTEGRIRTTTTIEVVQELAHARARRYGRRDAVALARNYATLLAPLLTTELADLEHGLQVFARHEEIGAFDAVLAAVALRSGARLVSADKGFATIEGLRFVSLADSATLWGP